MDKVAEAEVLPAETRKSEVAAINITPKTPMEMLNQAVANGASVEIMTKLMDLNDRWEAGQARKAFDQAVAAAKSEIPVIEKMQSGHNIKYAAFADYARVIDPILSDHGLSYRFRTEQSDTIRVTCILSHVDGHSEENSLSGPADTTGSKNSIQAIGSTLTYLQRYAFIQALGLASANDDDGDSAVVGRLISDKQFQTIRDMIDETGSDIARFCKFMNVSSIKGIREADFDKAIRSLESKKAKA